MAHFIYKEEVVRWMRVEIPECDAALDGWELEYRHRAKVMAQIDEKGWDSEDVLECHYAKDHTAEGMGL